MTQYIDINNKEFAKLKALYTFGNCQGPVFPLGLTHHKHKITSV